MNLDRVLARYPGRDCRRIDLTIGEKALWGCGLGTEIIRVLTRFGFEQEPAQKLFGCGIGDHNPRSLRASERAGYRIDQVIELPLDGKARREFDVVITREEHDR